VKIRIIEERSAGRKQRLNRRLDRFNYPDDLSRPMMRPGTVNFELADRVVGTAYGGLGLIHQLAIDLGLPQAIDRHLQVFKLHLPYHESDHVLNLAFNTLCGGTCLQDLELRRQDEAYLNLLGAERIPDPTTAGDFCRRFNRHRLQSLQTAIDTARLKIWAVQPREFFTQAIIDADGTMVETAAECKQGIDISHKGEWGYHPLVLTLANTGEVLRLRNRPGNRPSHENAAELFNESLALCRAAGFAKVLFRGDTDFSQTTHLDGWHEQGNLTFIFGYDCNSAVWMRAEDLPESAWKPLKRPPRYEVQTQPRTKPERVKPGLVEEHQYKNIQLQAEWVAEFDYQPGACRRAYRMVVVRKDLKVSDPQQGRMFRDYKYFFYILNDWTLSAEEVVYSANHRCNQENLLSQLHAARALHAPVDNLLSNEAYMLCTSLAWNLKAWLALRLPVAAGKERAAQHAEKQKLLRLEFRTFVNSWLRIPCQVLRTGRQLVCRVLAWNEWQDSFFRLVEALRHPLRC
jgi:hypothetical protein